MTVEWSFSCYTSVLSLGIWGGGGGWGRECRRGGERGEEGMRGTGKECRRGGERGEEGMRGDGGRSVEGEVREGGRGM